MNRIITLLLVISTFFGSAQDCKKYMTKKKDPISSKDFSFARVMTEQRMITFIQEGDKIYLRYFLTNRQVKSSLDMVQGAFIDSVRLDFEFANREVATVGFAASNSRSSGVTLKGAALTQYYEEITPELLENFASSRVRKYRIFSWGGNERALPENAEERVKWKTLSGSFSVDIMNAARCFSEAVK